MESTSEIKFQSIAQDAIYNKVFEFVESSIKKTGADTSRAIQQRIITRYLKDLFILCSSCDFLLSHGLDFGKEEVRAIKGSSSFVRFNVLIRNYWDFLFYLLASLGLLFKHCFRTNSFSPKSINILMASDLNQFISEDELERLPAFFSEIKATDIQEAELLIIEDPVYEKKGDSLIITTSYMKCLLKGYDFPLWHVFSILLYSFWHFLRFTFTCLRSPLHTFLGKENAFYPFIRYFNNKGILKNIYYTVSRVNLQEEWLSDLPNKKFTTHLFWYSLNSTGLNYSDDKVRSPHPLIRLVKADKSWSWSKEFNEWTSKNTFIREACLTYPLVWTTPKGKDLNYDIVIFDVTPVNSQFICENYSSKFFYYYSADHMIKFIGDILKASDVLTKRTGHPVKIALKHKRKYHRIHDERYIEFIANVESEGRLTIVDSFENIFDLLTFCKLSVVIPYSSPAEIAKYIHKTAVYYDPTGLLEPVQELVNSEEKLKEVIEEYVKSSPKYA